MSLQWFNRNYIYQSDTDKFKRKEVWEVIQPLNGKYRGDCESYLLTLLDLKLIPKETELYHCKLNGDGHCIGMLHGKVIDCNCQKFIEKERYEIIYDVDNFRKYWKIEILWKKLTTKLFGFVPFVN